MARHSDSNMARAAPHRDLASWQGSTPWTRFVGGLLLPALWAAPALAAPIQSPSPEGSLAVSSRIVALVRLSSSPVSKDALDELRTALGSETPAVRATAARVIHALGATPALPDLRRTLVEEKDGEAAFEEAWAIADLDTTRDSDDALIQALGRLDLRQSVPAGVVAGRGLRAAQLWPTLKAPLEAHPAAVVTSLRDGLHREAGTLFASFALRDGMENLFLDLLSSESLQVDAPVAVAGLAASSQGHEDGVLLAAGCAGNRGPRM